MAFSFLFGDTNVQIRLQNGQKSKGEFIGTYMNHVHILIGEKIIYYACDDITSITYADEGFSYGNKFDYDCSKNTVTADILFPPELDPMTGEITQMLPDVFNYIHYFNFLGVPNHRTGVSMFGYSLIKRTKKNNEYYMGIGTMIMTLSITAGWKYYFKKSNADDYYLAMSLVGNMGEFDNNDDETKKVDMDFIAGNFSAGYEKKLSNHMYLNMEIFTLTGIMPGIRYLVVPSFHFNYRI